MAKRDPLGLIGERLNRYKIEEFAGQGGMSVVYRARHEIGDFVVAIKILDPALAGDPKMVSAFLAEARNTAALRHPSIVRINDVDQTEEGWAYLVMEWLEGRTLYDELKEKGYLSIERVTGLLDLICGAIEYAHTKGIIHRDLKPGNIMLVADEREEETIRILDFGIAKVLDSTYGTNTQVAGTYFYTSPEQLTKGAPIDRRADIYSLGIVLYQMLTGERPFDADSMPEMIKLHCEASPKLLREINSQIPQPVEEVVLKAIAKKPADRYQSATDLARAFRNAASIIPATLIVECTDAIDQTPLAGASIYLNGNFVGDTDAGGKLRLDQLTPRAYRVEAESTGYLSSDKSFTLEPEEELEVALKLERELRGSLEIKCNVAGARVELDGEAVGVTDANRRFTYDSIAAGKHQVRLTHPKHLAVDSEVEIEAWQRSGLDLALQPRPGFQWPKFTSARVMLGAGLAIFLSLIAFGAYRLWGRPIVPPLRPKVVISPTPVATQESHSEVTPTPSPEAPASGQATFEELMAKAGQALRAKRYQTAVEAYQQAVAQRRGSSAAINGLMDSYYELGNYFLGHRQYKNAANTFQKALNIRPNEVAANLRLGDSYVGIPDYNKAIEQYYKAIKLGFNNPVVYVKLGNVYLTEGNYQFAGDQCAEAVRRDVKYLDAYSCVHKAFLAQLQGLDKARDFYRKLVETNPNNELALYHLGLVYVAQKRRNDAIAQYNKLQSLKSTWAGKLRGDIMRMAY
ncbi:MAG: protein kinase [Blastocatellia bacterium]|nr:protein kinase [Blastocatellia bacterium]